MRRAFTIVELLVIIAIMAAMTSVAVVSVRAGQDAARLRGAARDVVAQIRYARSAAMITRKPSYITYCTEVDKEGGEPTISVTVKTSAKFTARPTVAQTLDGKNEVQVGGDPGTVEGGGEEVTAKLFSTGIDPEVARGICLKVLREDEQLEGLETVEQKRSAISASAYVDGTKVFEEKADEGTASGSTAAADFEATTSPMTFRWETNGRSEPHRIWVYAKDTDPEESGLLIKVDRYGGFKVLAKGEDDE